MNDYDEEADKLVADPDFQYYSDDQPEDIQYKDDIIKLFNERLNERLRRK